MDVKYKAPKVIKDLIERYKRNQSEYKSKGYNEFQLRNEFITPFFEVLGWDVYNKSGAAPVYRDVILEDSIKVGGGTKAPDYCFTLSGRRMFFVETKKPSVSIKKDAKSAFQLRRYAWSSKLPLSILTNFEEFIVYECRQRPNVSDKPEVERVLSIHFTNYIEKWDEICDIFSYEAVKQGSFDRYAEEAKKKKGTQEVDDEFLKEIEDWREKLAKNIAISNTDLSVRELNYSVQRTIDRIIFLRMCEDKGIEKFGQLQSTAEKNNIYSNLCEIFEKSDEKYNSGLFHFKKERNRKILPDELTLKLKINDNVLKNIFRHLYYPNSPYEFSVISPEILGNVYEQFLGKIIRLTERHRAKIEEKPEVKKAGGVFYTPQYIVDYIVENTVGTLIKGKTLNQISKLKILDPACGSGSFLLGAYSKLLQHHLEYYSARKNPKILKDQIYKRKEGEWNLTIKEKKRILLNNIFGVDIDSQAVEVTKLSLLLKVLEGESKDIFEKQQKLWVERALPDLGNNIKCGNSLIGPDFYNGGVQTSSFNEDEMFKINAFDWNKEFSEIMESGGFDAVIGNPPYVLIGSDRKDEQEYFTSGKFELTSYKINTYILFLEKGLKLLGSEKSLLGYIIPKSLVFNTYFAKTRASLLENYCIPQVVEIREKVFKRAEVGDSILFFVQKCKNPLRKKLNYYKVTNVFPKFNILEYKGNIQSELLKNNEALFFTPPLTIKVNTKKLNEVAIVSNGLNPGNIRHILLSDKKETSYHKKLTLGRDMQRYSLIWSGTWVNYDRGIRDKVKITDIKSKKGMTPQKKIDFALRDPDIYKPNKILIRKTSDHIIASYDQEGYYYDSLAYGIQLKKDTKESIFYILGLLNSRLLNYIHDDLSQNKDKTFAKVLAVNLKKLPIRIINFSDKVEKNLHDKIVSLVNKIIELNKLLKEARTETKKIMLLRQINTTEDQIDNAVYELYKLSSEDIKLIKIETSRITTS